jgi:predicted acetylornithine/succinylornithine family transaminase
MNWLDQGNNLFLNVYRRLPLEIERGEDCFLFDRSGNRYLDFLSGLGVNALGYGHPGITKAIKKQIDRNLHLSNFFIQDVQIMLAQRLLALSGYNRIFFTNSGTESIEGILKLVKKYGNKVKKDQIITFRNAFHGRSLGSLSITAQEKYQKEFKPLLPHIIDLPFNDPKFLRKTISARTVAIFLEFVQGEGGVVPVLPDIVEILYEAQQKYHVLLVADEIQTGIGRTGKFFAYQHYDIHPDITAIAKAIGGGLPLGAFLVKKEFNEILGRGEHGTTFGGNPVSCAAGLALLKVFEEKNVLKHVEKMGVYLNKKLLEIKAEFPDIIKDVRGLGLMQALEMNIEAYPIVLDAIKRGVIFNSTAGTVLRILPPLIIEQDQIDVATKVLKDIFAR